MTSRLIELEGLTKRFGSGSGSILAVDGVSFSIAPGEVLGFLGPNGAGKSTTMKMITGYLAPTRGTAKVCGFDVTQSPLEVKARLGYLPEGAPAYADMTPESFLDFCARARGMRGKAKQEAIDRAVARTSLQGVLRQPIDTLSKGFKRRVGLAQAILHEPAVLIMDEPTDGLDPNQKHEVRRLIRELAGQGERAIVLSTHILEEVEAVCTRAIVIAKGKVVADATPIELAGRSRYHNAVTLSLVPPAGTAIFEEFHKLAGVAGVEDLGRAPTPEGVRVTCTVIPARGKDIAPAITQLVRSKNWRVEQMRTEGGRLDDVFRELTSTGAKN